MSNSITEAIAEAKAILADMKADGNVLYSISPIQVVSWVTMLEAQAARIAELEAELDLQKGDLMNLPKTIEEIESVIGKPDMYGGITNSGFYQVKDRRYYFTGHLCNTQITKIHAAIEAFTFLHVEALEARIAELEDREKQFKSGINHAFETADRAVSLGSQIAALAQTRSTLYGLLAILDGGKGAG